MQNGLLTAEDLLTTTPTQGPVTRSAMHATSAEMPRLGSPHPEGEHQALACKSGIMLLAHQQSADTTALATKLKGQLTALKAA